MHMDQVGFSTGLVAGGMVSLASATGDALANAARRNRNLRTIRDWAIALDQERTARIRAERTAQRLAAEIASLRQVLADQQYELEILRNC